MKNGSFKVVFSTTGVRQSGNDGIIAEKWGEKPQKNPESKTINAREGIKTLSRKYYLLFLKFCQKP